MSAKYTIGVCAMDTKARSKPMRHILDRILSSNPAPGAETDAAPALDVVVFGDKVILDEPVDTWPAVDFLVCFFSTGFPLQKAVDYVALRRPVAVNDVALQQTLLDRRLVLQVLDHMKIPTPERLVVNHADEPAPIPDSVRRKLKKSIGLDVADFARTTDFEQVDADTIRVGGRTMKKPFVEKPVSGEDHNVYIYYPESQGGGVRRLFRKVANKSSEFVPGVSAVRSDGSYIYERFVEVENAEDIKIYTVGENYALAETRKSPVVDGVVRRNADGKELRYVTSLNDEEREMAKKVGAAFGQTVCGFDLLRSNGRSFVIDVNGWSFVKNNAEYYDNCSRLLRDMFIEIGKKRGRKQMLKKQLSTDNQWKLKGFLAVMRHGDRTPKQKMKFTFTSDPFVNLLDGSQEEVILRDEPQLQRVLDACVACEEGALESAKHLANLRAILEKKMTFPGTKVQVKPSYGKSSKSAEKKTLEKLQLIVKWGGEFTHAGRHQSKDLAENLRKELLIINKALLDDVKIYTSTERRVMATAEIFIEIFLQRALSGDTAAVASSDKSDESVLVINKEMLDDTNAAKDSMEVAKARIQEILNPEKPLSTLPPHISPFVSDPIGLVRDVIDILTRIREIMRAHFETNDVPIASVRWCCSESPMLFRERWEKLFKDFCDVAPASFDPSKVSELYDSLKYDLLHNRQFCQMIFSSADDSTGEERPHLLKELSTKAKQLFDIVAPQEYGIEKPEKLEIGFLNAQPLLQQIINDLLTAKTRANPLTRIYFTKESKVICLLNLLMLCGLPVREQDKSKQYEADELDYLTQITFELYERSRGLSSAASEDAAKTWSSSFLDDSFSLRASLSSPSYEREYSLRVGFSPGAHDPNLLELQVDCRHSLHVAPRRWITDHIKLDEALKFLSLDGRISTK